MNYDDDDDDDDDDLDLISGSFKCSDLIAHRALPFCMQGFRRQSLPSPSPPLFPYQDTNFNPLSLCYSKL